PRGNYAAVELDEVSDDREAETESAVFAGSAGVALAEALEDQGEQVSIDSFAIVGDSDFDVRIDLLRADLNTAALGSKLDRVGEQVPEDLLQAVGIARPRTGGW